MSRSLAGMPTGSSGLTKLAGDLEAHHRAVLAMLGHVAALTGDLDGAFTVGCVLVHDRHHAVFVDHSSVRMPIRRGTVVPPVGGHRRGQLVEVSGGVDLGRVA